MIRLALVLSLLAAPTFAQTVRDIANRGACSTSGLEGISAQLAEAQRCQNPGAFVRFAPHPGITLSSSRVHPYLQASARDALHRAAARRAITVNSAFRTLADQYVLYHSGGCGLAARPGSSNHQSGRAVDVASYSTVRSTLESEGCAWLGSRDPVHFDCPGGDQRSQAVLAFQKLWNLNNPGDRIAEDGAYGPQTESRLARTPAGGFAADGCVEEPPPPPTGGRLIGVVYEGSDLEARIASASVRVVETGASMTADATGLWEFDLPAGEYTVEASADGYVTGTHRCSVATGDTWCSIGLTPGTPTGTGTARGTVFQVGEPDARISSARIMVTETGASAMADVDGEWSLELPPGTYNLAVSHEGYFAAMSECTVRAGEATDCSIGLTPEGLDGTLQGAVFEGANLARRIVGATVTVLETGASATSREGDGIFRIELPEGTYTLEASGEGFSTEVRVCTVRPGDTTWCSIGLDPLEGGETPLIVEEVDDIDDIREDEINESLRASGTVDGGCSTGGNGSAGALVFLAMLAIRRRR